MYQRKNQIQELVICLLDALCVVISFILAGVWRFDSWDAFSQATDFIPSVAGMVMLHIAVYYVLKVYEGMYSRGYLAELNKVIKYNVILMMGITAYTFAVKNRMELSRLTLGFFFILNGAAVYLTHQLVKYYMANVYRNRINASKLVVITVSDRAEKILKQMETPTDWNCRVVGLILLDEDRTGETFLNVPVIGNKNNYLDAVTHQVVDEVLIHAPRIQEGELYYKEMILELEKMGIVVNLNIDVFNLGVEDSKRVYRLGYYYVIAFTSRLFDYRLLMIKRLMDIVGSIIGLIFTAAAMIFIAPAILLESPGPLIFKQKRVGRNGRIFDFYKFRSMYQDAEERKKELMAQNEMQGQMFKIKNDPRITKVGNFIRKTSIDELPQFWNVLKGDMSLVGTRPPTLDEYENYESYQKRRISFRPGITGLWQISGRSNIKSFDEVVKLDLEYIDKWSIGLDIKILLKTIGAVFHGVGAR